MSAVAKAYLIGGAARTGKSSLALKVIERYGMPHGATDSMRTSLRLTTTTEQIPDLFYLDNLNVDEASMSHQMLKNTDHIIAAADRESLAVWPEVEKFVRAKLAKNQSVLVEGIGVLPEKLAGLDIPYSAVMLGNLSNEHEAIIQNFAKYHPDTWLGSLKSETISSFAHFVQEYSQHTQVEAMKYHIPFIDMGDRDFMDGLNLAVKTLFAA